MRDLDVYEATSLLVQRLSGRGSKIDDQHVRGTLQPIIRDDLGRHPLAILQAGGVLETLNNLSIADLSQRFASLPGGPEGLLQQESSEPDYSHTFVSLESFPDMLRKHQSQRIRGWR